MRSEARQLAGVLLGDAERIAARSVARMRELLPSYAKVPAEQLLPVTLGNTRHLLEAVRDPDADPVRDEGRFVVTRLSHETDEMLQAWRIGLEVVREEAHPVASRLGIADDVLLAFVEATLRWGDLGMRRSAAVYRETEIRELERLAAEQVALRRVAILVAQGGQPGEVFDTVAAELAGLLQADHVVVCRYEPGTELTVLAHRGTSSQEVPPGTRISHDGDSVEAVVWRTQQSARLESYEEARGTIAELARAAGVQVAVGAPVVVDGRPWGVASAGWNRGQHPPADTEQRMAKFAELLGTAVANAEARAELRELADQEAALRRVATLVARAASAEEVFAAVTAEAGRTLGADLARMSRYGPEGAHTVVAGWTNSGDTMPVAPGTRWDAGGQNVAALVFRTGRPARIDDYSDATGSGADLLRRWGMRCTVGAPVRVADRLWGVLAVGSRAESLPADTEERMAKFAELLSTAVANADSRDQLAASRARLVTEADEARRRVVRDLHDGAQQRLLQTIVTLKLAQRAIEPDSDTAEALIAEALAHAQQANTELRDLAHGILPAVLAQGGLRSGVSSIVSRLDLPVEVDVPSGRFPAEIEASAYFVVAEALTNVVKHSHAGRAAVRARVEDGMLLVEVRDDGVGGADPSGHGLVGLGDRVTAMGGQLMVESPEGGGTLLAAKLPVTSAG